jgi:hypothetical protein
MNGRERKGRDRFNHFLKMPIWQNHRHTRIDRLLIGTARPPALFWLSNYVASHNLAVAPQSGAKDQYSELSHHL